MPKFDNPAALSALARGDLDNAMVAATPGGIEAQEKAGQTELVNSTNMPLDLDREAFEKVGFKFGDPIDDVFQEAQLPEGWSRATTDHSMHSHILDEQGRARVSVFYKAAFYDRNANAHLCRRYGVRSLYGELAGCDLADDERAHAVYDCDTEIWRSEVFKAEDDDSRRILDKSVRAWLAEHYPNADDPTAYWDN